MGMLIMMNRGNYTNTDAAEHVIRYITRTREEENRRDELLGYGGAGIYIYCPIEHVVRQFLIVQETYNIKTRKGKRIYHEVFSITEVEYKMLGKDIQKLHETALECCRVYLGMGHQSVYGIHCNKKEGVHIHFAVNTINFMNGKKWHTSNGDTWRRNEVFNGIVQKYCPERIFYALD